MRGGFACGKAGAGPLLDTCQAMANTIASTTSAAAIFRIGSISSMIRIKPQRKSCVDKSVGIFSRHSFFLVGGAVHPSQ